MSIDPQSYDVQHFQRWSHSYESSWLQQHFFDRVHLAVLSLATSIVSQPTNVLDIGCGTGRLLRKAGQLWPDTLLQGVDPAEGMVEVARRLTPAATFYSGSAEAIPLPEASVDLAVSTISFHHWHDQMAGIREVARVLRPGGHFILADFYIPAWVRSLLPIRRFHTRAQLCTMFTQTGLEVQTQQVITLNFVLATVGRKPEA